jgi:tetraacyldisaccharide 4'-kinase
VREPRFWQHDGLLARVLQPAATLYTVLARSRCASLSRERLPVPVVCVGAATVGGSGKTPVARAVAHLLREAGAAPHVVLRGYGGSLPGPLRVDPTVHGSARVGDEALLHAADGPTWVARRRIEGARAAIAAGAGSIVLDDGLQHPGLTWSLALLVVDGGQGVGNGRVLPAGPLREPWPDVLARADAAVCIGDDEAGIQALAASKPLIEARIESTGEALDLAGRRVLAFAGIARPDRFRRSLERLGAEVARFVPFADHHRYRERELFRLWAVASRERLTLVTTAKDAVRLPPDWHRRIRVLQVRLVWQDAAAIRQLLAASLAVS